MNLDTAKKLLDGIRESVYFAGLSNDQLFDALWERLESQFDVEQDSEVLAILCEISSRLARLQSPDGERGDSK